MSAEADAHSPWAPRWISDSCIVFPNHRCSSLCTELAQCWPTLGYRISLARARPGARGSHKARAHMCQVPSSANLPKYSRLPSKKFLEDWPQHSNDFFNRVVQQAQPFKKCFYTLAQMYKHFWILSGAPAFSKNVENVRENDTTEHQSDCHQSLAHVLLLNVVPPKPCPRY